MERTVICLLVVKKFIKLERKILLCLGNVSKDWTVDNMKTGVNSLNKIPLSCISMNNQECKVRPQFVSVNGDDPVFFFIVLKQINPAVVATISIIHMQNCVFLMLLKI